jgi:hypothetical protein
MEIVIKSQYGKELCLYDGAKTGIGISTFSDRGDMVDNRWYAEVFFALDNSSDRVLLKQIADIISAKLKETENNG